MNNPIRLTKEISFGHLLQAATIIVGLIFGYATMVSRVDALEAWKTQRESTDMEIVRELRRLNETQAWMRGRMEEKWGERRND